MKLTLDIIRKNFNIKKGDLFLYKGEKCPKSTLKIPHYMNWIFGQKIYSKFDVEIKRELKIIGEQMFHQDTSLKKIREQLEPSKHVYELLFFFAGIVISIFGGYISNVIYDIAKK